MKINILNWKTPDNYSIHACNWHCENPKAVVLLVHGLGDHARRYDHVAAAYNAAGIAVVGVDLRGHGQSDSLRGHIVSFDTVMNDMDLFLKNTKALYKKIPVFIYGHSMGSNIVLNYVVRRSPKISGVIGTSSWIILGFAPSAFMVFLGKAMRNIYPAFTQANQLNTNHISRIPIEVKAYEDDPLVHNKITAATGADVLKSADYLRNHKAAFPCPLYLIHGSDDQLISVKGSELFYENHKNNSKDISIDIVEGGYHELQNDIGKEAFIEKVVSWVSTRV